jgi:hypothetical protein
MADNHFDEVQFQTLWVEGLDPMTAAAASYESGERPQPATYSDRRSFNLGLLAGLVLFILWQFI